MQDPLSDSSRAPGVLPLPIPPIIPFIPGEFGAITEALGGLGITIIPGERDDPPEPRAYLRYRLYDADSVLVDEGRADITEDGEEDLIGTPEEHEPPLPHVLRTQPLPRVFNAGF